MKTFIDGKECSLEDTISSFKEKLKRHGFNIEEVSWLNPAKNIWSVHIRDKEAPMNFTNGKGATKKAALASALGEYFERLSTNYFYADYFLDLDESSSFVHYPNEKWFKVPEDNIIPSEILSEELLKFYDPTLELLASDLIDLQSSNIEKGICSIPFTNIVTQEKVYFPINLIGNLYVSNGMSAGNSIEEATVQALSEIFERHIKNIIIKEALSLPEIPLNILKEYPDIHQSVKDIESKGFTLKCFDASLGGKYPVICSVLIERKSHTCISSFGSHPKFKVALERTVTELLQGRELSSISANLSEPTFNKEIVSDIHNLELHFIDSSGLLHWNLFSQNDSFDFIHWNHDGNTAEELQKLISILTEENLNIFIAEYNHLDVNCCRVIVPSWSEVYQPEELIESNNNSAISLRETIFNLPNLNLSSTEYAALFEQLESLNFDDNKPVFELLGFIPPKKSKWKELRLGELKGMVALAGGDLFLAKEYVDWYLSNNFSTDLNIYKCLNVIIDIYINDEGEINKFKDALSEFFETELIETCIDLITGKQRFINLSTIILKDLQDYQLLLNSYKKLQRAKLEC